MTAPAPVVNPSSPSLYNAPLEERKARCLIYSMGTRGDFQPYLAFSQVLKSEFEIGFLTHEIFQRDIEQNDFAFFGLAQKDPNDILNGQEFKEAFWKGSMIDQANALGKGMEYLPKNFRLLWKACEEWNPDLILCTITTHQDTLAVSQKMNIPCMCISTIPYYPSRFMAPCVIFGSPFQWTWINQMFNNLALWGGWMAFKTEINSFRKELSLLPQQQFTIDAFPFINIYSPLVVADPEDWDSNRIHTVGYFIDQLYISDVDDTKYTPSPELASFLSHEDAPVYIGLGSMPILDCLKFVNDVLQAMESLGMRAILCAGWSELSTIEHSDSVLFIKGAPHEWLFPKCSAIVHHGGAGTTAASLRSGRPTIIYSVLADQNFWATQVHRLGCGPPPFKNGIKDFNAVSLQAVLTQVLNAEDAYGCKQKAAEFARELRQENGCVNALAIVKSYFDISRNKGLPRFALQDELSCGTCKSQFSYFFGKAKYRCQACGSCYCFDCLEMKPLINYSAAQLVCASCKEYC